jgi:acyl-CoA thioesterase-1
VERRVGSSGRTRLSGVRTGLGFGAGILATALVALPAASCGKHGSDAPSADSTGTATTTQSNAGQLRPPSSATAASARSTVLFVGTSLTAGLGLEPDSAYPMLIQRKIDSAGLPFDVVNAGVSGETSSGLLDRLDWVLRGKFAVLVLETGANDGLRGIPPATLRTNLESALDRIKSERPDADVVLVQMEALPNLGPKYAADFHRVYPAVAKEKGVTLIPFLLDGVAGHRGLNQADGVHPNNAGERIVADNVWAGLMPVLRKLSASGVP